MGCTLGHCKTCCCKQNPGSPSCSMMADEMLKNTTNAVSSPQLVGSYHSTEPNNTITNFVNTRQLNVSYIVAGASVGAALLSLGVVGKILQKRRQMSNANDLYSVLNGKDETFEEK